MGCIGGLNIPCSDASIFRPCSRLCLVMSVNLRVRFRPLRSHLFGSGITFTPPMWASTYRPTAARWPLFRFGGFWCNEPHANLGAPRLPRNRVYCIPCRSRRHRLRGRMYLTLCCVLEAWKGPGSLCRWPRWGPADQPRRRPTHSRGICRPVRTPKLLDRAANSFRPMCVWPALPVVPCAKPTSVVESPSHVCACWHLVGF